MWLFWYGGRYPRLRQQHRQNWRHWSPYTSELSVPPIVASVYQNTRSFTHKLQPSSSRSCCTTLTTLRQDPPICDTSHPGRSGLPNRGRPDPIGWRAGTSATANSTYDIDHLKKSRRNFIAIFCSCFGTITDALGGPKAFKTPTSTATFFTQPILESGTGSSVIVFSLFSFISSLMNLKKYGGWMDSVYERMWLLYVHCACTCDDAMQFTMAYFLSYLLLLCGSRLHTRINVCRYLGKEFFFSYN